MKTDFAQHAWGWIALVALSVGVMSAIHSSEAFAERVEIFDVRKSLSMGPKDVSYKDYYLTAGRESGLKENMIVAVIRSNPVFDHARNVSRGDLEIRVGQLKVIFVGDKMSVARAYTVASRATHPVVEVEGFMVGDRLDLSEAYLEKGDAQASAEPAETPKAATPAPAAAAAVKETPKEVAPAPVAPKEPSPKIESKLEEPVPKREVAAEKEKTKSIPILGEIPGATPATLVR